ncbi:MAG: ribosome maturation factor RimP [Erysipelotrichaceae bacterium]|nr:ribosome maturation factor RimP [Erysipelotrichaceae bacterium]
MVNLEKIATAIKPVIDANDISDHSLRFIPGNPAVLELALERREGNVDLDFCEKVSKEVSAVLDEVDDSADSYMLDVCSFGAERVLEDDRQIKDHVGSYVHIDLLNPQKGLDKIEGYLDSFEDDVLTVSYMEKTFKRKTEISRDNIRLIRLAVKL